MSGRPAVVTLFGRLFLWNGMTNSRTVILARARPGGGGTYVPPPHRFFADSRKMAARSAAKFGIAV